jgi:hypothetical protein
MGAKLPKLEVHEVIRELPKSKVFMRIWSIRQVQVVQNNFFNIIAIEVAYVE